MFVVLSVDGRFVDYVDGRFILVASWESAIPHDTVHNAYETYLNLPMDWQRIARMAIVSNNRCYFLAMDTHSGFIAL
jgi:hypothetical protein